MLTGLPVSERLAKMEYRFFKRDSIKTAIAEINAITDIDVELVEYKAGKSIDEIQFLIRPKAQASLPLKAKAKPIDVATVNRALSLGIPDEKAEELINQFGRAAVTDGLDALEKRIATAYPEPIRDAHRYLKALLEGEQLQKIPDLAPEPATVGPGSNEPPRDKKKEAAVRATWQDEWLRRERQKVIHMLRQLQSSVVQDLTNQLVEHMTNTKMHPSLVKRLQTSGWDHNLVRHLMIDYYAKGTLGESWDKPTTEQLLEVASQLSDVSVQH